MICLILQQQRFAKVRQTRLCTQIVRQVGQACICRSFSGWEISYAFSLHLQKSIPLSPCESSWVIPVPALVCIPGLGLWSPPTEAEFWHLLLPPLLKLLEKTSPSWSYHLGVGLMSSSQEGHTSLGLTLEWSGPMCVCKVSDYLRSRPYLIKTWLNTRYWRANHH